MAILKKIRGATLVETLISSVVIVAVFLVGSISLSNIFHSSVLNDDFSYRNRIKELEYLGIHDKLDLPFYEETNDWGIAIEKKAGVIYITAILKKKDVQTVITIDAK